MYTVEGTILDRREMLRVKIKSLAAESKIIRHEELRSRGEFRAELWRHRTGDVRSEARVAHLAYGFIRGRKYEEMEAKALFPPNWERVRQLVKKFGPTMFEDPPQLKKAA